MRIRREGTRVASLGIRRAEASRVPLALPYHLGRCPLGTRLDGLFEADHGSRADMPYKGHRQFRHGTSSRQPALRQGSRPEGDPRARHQPRAHGCTRAVRPLRGRCGSRANGAARPRHRRIARPLREHVRQAGRRAHRRRHVRPRHQARQHRPPNRVLEVGDGRGSGHLRKGEAIRERHRSHGRGRPCAPAVHPVVRRQDIPHRRGEVRTPRLVSQGRRRRDLLYRSHRRQRHLPLLRGSALVRRGDRA